MNYRSILHIDDDEDDQEIFQAALDALHLSVQYTPVNNAITALKGLSNGDLAPDLVFLDLNMPEMDGKEFLIQLKQKTGLQDIPVIVLSTSSNDSTINQVKSLGARAFITKPTNFTEFSQVLQNILQ